jgi:hypothetical protein
VRKALPPHLRHSRASDNTISSIVNASVAANILPERRDSVMDSVALSTLPTVPEGSRKSSLRATADVFKPKTSPALHTNTFQSPNALPYIPEEQWYNMSPEEKESVILQRSAVKNRGRNTLPPHRTAETSFSGGLQSHFLENMMARIGITNDSQSVGSYPGTQTVRVGQVLTPSLTPSNKSVSWSMRDLDGKETPVNFGRAPPPSVPGLATPALSLGSDVTTPARTPYTARGWRIGSTMSPSPYGWKGGDGKEISFSGYGPHAERYPSNVVDFSFNGKTASFGTGVSNGFEVVKENSSPSESVAPKSQRQWAEKVGYPKIPCGNMEITHAVEQMPFASELAGYCYDCAAN